MRTDEITIGGSYACKVSGKLAPIRIVHANPLGGVRVRSAARLHRPLGPSPLPVGTPDDWVYRIDVTDGDRCDEHHHSARGKLWVCQLEVNALPA